MDFPPLERRYFGITIDGKDEPLVTPSRTTVEAAVRDVWDFPYPTGEKGWWIFSIDHDDEGIRVELVDDTIPTDEVMESARRVASGEATEEDLRRWGVDPRQSDADDAEG
jgi:hypothetical protein